MTITTHQIGLHSLSGAIFWCILSAVIFYVLGFATVGWEYGYRGFANYWVGLWNVCQSQTNFYANEGKFNTYLLSANSFVILYFNSLLIMSCMSDKLT